MRWSHGSGKGRSHRRVGLPEQCGGETIRAEGVDGETEPRTEPRMEPREWREA